MFKKKTVLVVGAGANAGHAANDLRMPTGKELAGRIASLLDIRFADGYRLVSGDYSIVEALKMKNGNGNIGEYGAAARLVSGNMPIARSIDNFIEARKGEFKVQACGKLAIVKAILSAERESPLYSDINDTPLRMLQRTSNSWLARFFEYLTLNVSSEELEDALSRVEIVCFNYDRCIERYLPMALDNYYSLGVSAAQSLVRDMRIFHPYGTIGNLGWQETGAAIVSFGQNLDNPHALLNSIDGIKTFSEQIHDKNTILEIRHSIQEAETVLFLGFSFYTPNIKLILPEGRPRAKRIFATAFGISKADTESLDFELRQFFPDLHKVELRNDLFASNFFDEYQRSLSEQ